MEIDVGRRKEERDGKEESCEREREKGPKIREKDKRGEAEMKFQAMDAYMWRRVGGDATSSR